MFSLLLPIFYKDCPTWFKESLESALIAQDLKPDQVVIVCDGEISEELERLIDNYKSKFKNEITVLKLKENLGLGAALNKGLEVCKYDLVARLDADDICLSNRFATQISFMNENEGVDILGSSATIIDSDGVVTGSFTVPENHESIYRNMWACPIIHPSVIFRKSKVLQAGSYSTHLRRRQDYELWFRCAKDGCNFYNIQEPLIKYRVTDDSHKRNSLSVAWEQYKIGLNGVRALELGWRARVGVLYPVIKALMPLPVRKALIKLVRRFDPRVREGV